MEPKQCEHLVKLCKELIATCKAAHKMKQYRHAPEIGQLLYGEMVSSLLESDLKLSMPKIIKNLKQIVNRPALFLHIVDRDTSLLLFGQLVRLNLESNFQDETCNILSPLVERQRSYSYYGIPFPGYN